MQPVAELSLEQRFKLAALEKDIENLTLEEARNYIRQLIEQNMIKDNIIKQWMKTK